MPPAARRDQGSAAVELVLVTPLLIMMLMFIIAVGRLVDARMEVNGAAMQAARAASVAADAAAAGPAALATAQAALSSERVTCSTLAVFAGTSDFQAGGQVSVTASCTVSLAGLSLLPLPGAETLTATAVAPIDEFRDQALVLSNSEGLADANSAQSPTAAGVPCRAAARQHASCAHQSTESGD
jgi:Flp pilus assembly protein TadG